MIFSKKYFLLAYTLLRGQVKYFVKYFSSIKQTLQKADMNVSLEEYIASFLLTMIIGVPAIVMLVFFFLTASGVNIISIVIFDVLALGLFAGVIYGVYMFYPSYKVHELKNALDKHVAFAATHMATIAGTGVPPHVIFQMIGSFEEYGDIARICSNIHRDITIFGYDTISAISEEAQKTPSHKFKDLLWSIVATIRTGGDLRAMLIAKSKALMDEQRRIEAEYVETLSMMAEIYSTIFVAGVIMIFVLISIMGILGGLPIPVKLVLELTTYLGVPLASVAFIFMIESSKPSGV